MAGFQVITEVRAHSKVYVSGALWRMWNAILSGQGEAENALRTADTEEQQKIRSFMSQIS